MSKITTKTLYRKYRPQSFAEVIGQSKIVSALQHQVESGTIAHAYLFSGGRGTGKTSIARIMARELGTNDTDLYEIDAASNRGINEIRELRDGVTNLPFESPYKVYIIDEVHMLTKEAFNALLKTLEEPPSHVVFILATTEKHKVLETILSRCQVYDFSLATQDDLVELITQVASGEGRTLDQESARYIARLGNGSFRDTLSHLQKVFATPEKDITISQVQNSSTKSLGTLENDLLQALSQKDQDQVFVAYQTILEQNIDITQLVESLLDTIRVVLMLRNSKKYLPYAQNTMPPETIDLLSNLPGITSHTLRDMLGVYELIHQSGRNKEALEIFLHQQFESD